MKKAQASIEFLFVIGIILLLSTFVLYDVFTKRDQVDATTQFLLKKDLCLHVASFISGTFTKGIGTEAYLLVGADYISYPVVIQPVSRNLFVGDKKAAYCTIPISSVSNSSEKVSSFRFYFDAINRVLKFENIEGHVIVSLHNRSVIG